MFNFLKKKTGHRRDLTVRHSDGTEVKIIIISKNPVYTAHIANKIKSDLNVNIFSGMEKEFDKMEFDKMEKDFFNNKYSYMK
jgi:hypothetical protein